MRLEIRDGAGNTFHNDRDLWLAPGAEARVTVDLPLVEVSGRVSLADQPQMATLHFGGRRGSRHIEMSTDDEGLFEGTLPKAGVWRVGVETAEFSTFTKVTVTPGLDEHRAEVNIELPDTHLFGRVVDEAGQTVAGVTVEVSAAGYYQDLVTDAAGSFEAKAIAPGVITVAADFRMSGREPLTSEPQVLDLREEKPLGPIELRLRSLERRTVKVHRGSYPVPGAVISLRSRDGSRYGDDAISDAEGTAQVRVDPRTREWDVLLLAPGATLSAFRRTNDGSPLEFQVEEGGGELTIELPQALGQILSEGLHLTILRDETPIGLERLVHWRRGLGLSAGVESDAEALTFPRLASGQYTVCLEMVERSSWVGGQEPLHCRSGRLVPGGSLTLRLPKSPP